MKSACVVLQSKNVLSDSRFCSITDAFGVHGFAFDETRILNQADEKTVLSALTELKAKYEFILLLSNKTSLALAKQFLQKAFPEGIYQGGADGSGVYDSQKSICQRRHCYFLPLLEVVAINYYIILWRFEFLLRLRCQKGILILLEWLLSLALLL